MNVMSIKDMIAKSRSEDTDHEIQVVADYRFAVWRNNFADRYDVFVREPLQTRQKKISAKNAQTLLDSLTSNKGA